MQQLGMDSILCNLERGATTKDGRYCIRFRETRDKCPDRDYRIEVVRNDSWMTSDYTHNETSIKNANGTIYGEVYSKGREIDLIIRVTGSDHTTLQKGIFYLLQHMSPKTGDWNKGYRYMRFDVPDYVENKEKTRWTEAKVLKIRQLGEGELCRVDFAVTLGIGNADCSNPGCFFGEDTIPDDIYEVNLGITQVNNIPGGITPILDDPIAMRQRVEDLKKLRQESVTATGFDFGNIGWAWDTPSPFNNYLQGTGRSGRYLAPSCCPLSFEILNRSGNDAAGPFMVYTLGGEGNFDAFKIDLPALESGYAIERDGEKRSLLKVNLSTGETEDIYNYVDLKYTSAPKLCPDKWILLDPDLEDLQNEINPESALFEKQVNRILKIDTPQGDNLNFVYKCTERWC